MKAMVLAAGLGTRMAPLSKFFAKPVLPVLDRSLLAHHLHLLAALGMERAVVNAHAHWEQVREELARTPLPVDLSHEPELLGSGGGIRRAARFLAGREPFLVINADMCVEFASQTLLEAQRRQRAPIAVLLRDDPRKHTLGSIGYGIDGRVCRITDRYRTPSEEAGSGLYTGIQLMSGDIFDRFPERDAFELLPEVWVPLLASGAPIAAALQPAEQLWEPVGTPGELLAANLSALRRLPVTLSVHPSARVEGQLEPPVWIGAGAAVSPGARIGPGAVIGARAVVPGGCRVSEAVLLPDAKPEECEIVRAVAFGSEVWRGA